MTLEINCDGSTLLTDVHIHTLSQFDWPYLESIRIRACPHITPFARNYLQLISNKITDRNINIVRFEKKEIFIFFKFKFVHKTGFEIAFSQIRSNRRYNHKNRTILQQSRFSHFGPVSVPILSI